MSFDTSLDLLVDTLSTAPWTSDSGGTPVSPNVTTGQLKGGGYYTAWATDPNVDGLPDSIAVQRFTAQGNPIGLAVQLGQLPLKQLVGTDQDLRDLFAFDALNGGGYSLAYRVPVPRADFTWSVAGGGIPVSQVLNLVGKPTQFKVSGDVANVTFALRGLVNGVVTDVPLSKTTNADGTTTVQVSAANLSQFGNVERLSLFMSGTSATAALTVTGSSEENWRYFADSGYITHNAAGQAFAAGPGTPPYAAVLSDPTGRAVSFHVSSVTAAAGTPVAYSLVFTATPEVYAALGIFPPLLNSVAIDGLNYEHLANGAVSIGYSQLVPDVNGNIAVPGALLAALGYHDASIALVASNVASGSSIVGTVTVAPPTVVTPGLHSRVYDFTGTVIADNVIDTSTAAEWIVDRDGAPANPHVITGNLVNGGYYVGWLADANHDGLPESIAVQKFAADGTTSGAVTLLGQLPILQLAGAQDIPAHLYDIEALGSGGYAMSYEVPAPVDGVDQPALTANSNGQASLFFVGKPHAFTISTGLGSLANATFSLRGLNASGQQIDVAIGTNIAGFTTLNVTAAQLAQFANPERVSLLVTNATAGATFGVHAALEPNWRYAGTEATVTSHLSGTVQQIGAGFGAFLSSGSGRVESFHVAPGAVTAASGSPTYSMSVTTDGEARANLGLLSVGQSAVHDGFTYTLQGNGILSVTGAFAPDGAGNIAVPTWLLSSLAYQDAGITLVIGNLAQNSTFSGDVTYRQPTVVIEGIHTRVYDSSGVLQFDHTIDTSAAHEWLLDTDGLPVNPNVTTGELAGGGYYTSWLADTDSDGLPDAIGVQRFDAAGTAVGGVVKLAGLPLKDLPGTQLDAGQLYSLDALSDGSYTASFSVPPPNATFTGTLGNGSVLIGSTPVAYGNTIALAGVPKAIAVSSSNASLGLLSYQLVGIDKNGVQGTVSFGVTFQNGVATIYVPSTELVMFANPERLSFRVQGLTSGQTVSVSGTVAQDQRYFPDQPLATTHVDAAAFLPAPSSTVYVAAAGSASRAESFHVASVTAASGGTISWSLQVTGSTGLGQLLGLTPGVTATIGGLTYTLNLNGSVSIGRLSPDANGNIAVPANVLNLLEYHDAGIALVAANLAQGSTLSVDVTYRTPLLVDDGIYTRTYDPAGNITWLHPTSGADNLLGGIAADTVNALAGNDTFHGGQGNDSLDGGTGVDVSTYDGTRGSATVTRNPTTHALTVSTSLDGADTVRHVEQFKFADGLYSFTYSGAGAPVVANFNPAFGWASQDQYPRHVADVNGDGYLDIVGFGTAGVLVSFGSAGGTFTGAALQLADYGQNSGWATDNGFHRELADVNGDGRADILGFGFAGTLVSLANANGTFAPVSTGVADFGVNQGWANQNGFARTVGDVNGDGKADLVGFGFAGALVALGNGNGTFQSVKTAIANFGVNQGWTSDNTFHRAVADVNGDGKADIIGFGFAGTYVALAKGDGTFADAQLVLNDFGTNQGWSSNDSFSRLVADVNGDHIADIVGFGIAGTLVAFGKGDGIFTQASLDVGDFGKNQGWVSDNTFHREVADVNHDGLADVVGFGIAGVLAGTNQGDFLI